MSGAWLRWANWIVSGLLALCAIGTAAVTVLGRLAPEVGWSIAGALAVGSTAATQLEKLLNRLQKALRRQQQEQTKREQELRDLLRTRRLLRVEDADPIDLGVRPSRSAKTSRGAKGEQRPPYVSRVRDNVDQKLRQHLLQRKPFVLLIGESRAGKSRTAFEAAVSQDADLRGHVLIAPVRFGIKRDTLSRIFALLSSHELGQPPVLLWLDDLHHYLDTGALDPSHLAAWRQQHPRVIVLATIRSGEYNRLRFPRSRGSANKSSEILEQARSVLEQADWVEMPADLSSDEIAEAEALYPGHDWTRVGIGEELVLAPAMLDKFITATADDAALVKAAVDWERAGLTRPIPKPELEELWQTYRRQQRPQVAATDRFETALEWATTFIEDSDSSLVYTMEGGYDVDDYVVAHREAQHAIPTATWRWVIRTVSPEEAYAVGLAAYSRGEYRVSVEAWQRAGEEAAPPTAASALVSKGAVLAGQGHAEQAIAVYEEVERRFGQAEEPALQVQVAEALVHKALTLRLQGQSEQAIAAYEEVVQRFGQAEEPALQVEVAMARINKLAVQVDLAGALVDKGFALRQQGKHEQAVAAYEEVVRHFSRAWEPVLQEHLARALVSKRITLRFWGQLEQAKTAFEEVEQRFGDALVPVLQQHLAIALGNKGAVLGDQGRPDEAITAFEEVERRFGQAQEPALQVEVARALVNKAVALGQQGRPELAAAAYEEVERRFGQAQEPALQEQVASARFKRALLESGEPRGDG